MSKTKKPPSTLDPLPAAPLRVTASRRHQWLMLIAIIVSVACGLGWLTWSATRDPDVAFLSPEPGARWIVYPKVRKLALRRRVMWDAEFRREFDLDRPPSTATVDLRAFRSATLWINDRRVSDPKSAAGNWRPVQQYDVGRFLRAGQNQITVMVENENGPPALWLRLDAGDVLISTDESWTASLMGAADRPARLASRALPAASNETGRYQISAAEAWRDVWPIQLLIIAAATGIVIVGGILLRRWHVLRAGASDDPHTRAWLLVLGLIAVPWIVLIFHNAPYLDHLGFDGEGHLEYTQYMLDNRSVPLADEGWEMFQPPLYYALLAGAIGMAGVEADAQASVWVYRPLGLVIALAQIGVIFLALRLLFPTRPRGQLVGLILAAGMPMHMYLAHYPSNEMLAALLATTALYLALRILRDESESLNQHAILGAVLGAAMLTKFSALLVTVAVLMVLAGALVARRQWRPVIWGRTIGVAALAWLLVCGWHYARVWVEFGSPLIGNWDPITGFVWWQDPGYHVLNDYLRFGAVFVRPLFSAQNGMLDGFYATAWGDSLVGSVVGVDSVPPWNYRLLSAGYVLAVVPTLLLLVGTITALIQLIRRPQGGWLLLLGLVGVTMFAVLLMSIRVPNYGHAKAFYALPLMLAWCALSYRGFEVLRRWWPPLGSVMLVLLVAWAINAYLTYWIRPDHPQALLVESRIRFKAEQGAEATDALARRVEIDPTDGHGWRELIGALVHAGRINDANEARRAAAQHNPRNFDLHVMDAELALLSNDPAASLRYAAMAAELAPHARSPHRLRGMALLRLGRTEQAIDPLRETLRFAPDDAIIHQHLAQAYRRLGRSAPAERHADYAERFAETGIRATDAASQD